MDTLWQDIRYGLRMLTKNLGFTAVAVLTLALGIGANTAIFSVVNAVLLRPLPYPESDRLVRVWEDPGSNPRNYVNPRNFADWRDQNQVFERVAAFYPDSINLTGGQEPERIVGALATAGFFATLGVEAALGRTFLPADDQPGQERVAVLNHGLWQRRFGADPSVIGRALLLDGGPARVIGVMPPDFRFPQTAEIWLPLVFTAGEMSQTSRGSHYLHTVARLKPGISLEQARAELETIYNRLRAEYPDLARWNVRVVGMLDDAVGDVRPALLVLLSAVGFVLLIACANVASLMLARATARQREIAIRAALGARRLRLVRQLLTESLLLALLGGGLGVMLGLWGMDWLISLNPENLPRLEEVSMDGRVLAVTLLLSMLSGVVFGLAPALSASQPDLNGALKEAGRASASGRSSHLRRVFVVAQTALSLVLLIGAGLLIKSFIALGQVDPGFKAEQVLTMQVSLPSPQYAEPARRISFYQHVVERLRHLPGVASAALVSDPPISGLEGLWRNRFDIEGQPTPPPGQRHYAYVRWITADYFQTMGIPLLKGRALTEADTAERPWVMVIDEALARRYFPDEDPIGKRLVISMGERRPREIVGVVGNVRQTALDQSADPQMYIPYSQTPLGYATLLVRTSAGAASMAAAVKQVVLAVDRNQPIYGIMPMEQIIAESLAVRRFNTLLLGLFAGVALALAAIGIYGTLAYLVGQRTQEIGIRLALGAQRRDILRLIVGEGMILTLVGAMAGLAASLALTRFLSSLLFGVSATDPLTFTAVTSLLVGVALLACWIPARRATRVDPMVALRYE